MKITLYRKINKNDGKKNLTSYKTICTTKIVQNLSRKYKELRYENNEY